MEEIKPCIVVIGGGILGGDKALYRSDRRRGYLEEIKPCIVVIGGGILILEEIKPCIVVMTRRR